MVQSSVERKVCGPVQCGRERGAVRHTCLMMMVTRLVPPHTHHSSVAYEPVTMIRIPVLGAILARNRGGGVAVE